MAIKQPDHTLDAILSIGEDEANDVLQAAKQQEKKQPPPLPVEANETAHEEGADDATEEIEDGNIEETISIQKLEDLKKFRADLAKAELVLNEAERKMDGFLSIFNLEKKGAAYKDARDVYEAAKEKYQQATAELNGAKIEAHLDELLNLSKERTTAWKQEHSVKSKFARAWEWFSTANAFEALLGNTEFVKGWRKFNESSTGWAKGSRMSGAMKFLGKVASRGLYNLGTPRGAIAAALTGVGAYSAGIGESGLLAGSQAVRGGLGLVGGYVGGSAVARNLTEWGVNRGNKKILENSSAAVSKEEVSERYEAALTRYANVSESLRRGIPNKKLREAKEAELRELSKQVGEFASKLEGGVSRLQEDTMKKTEATRKSRSSREVWYQTAGLVGGLTLGGIGLNRTIETLGSTGGASVASEENMSRGVGAIEPEEENKSVWRPGEEAIVAPKMPVGEMASWDDVGKNQLDAAAQLGKALGLKGPISIHELEKVARANHLLDTPSDLKSALNAVVSVEIDPNNRLSGDALKTALRKLGKEAGEGNLEAAATLKKFFEQPPVNMKDIDPSDLDEDEIKKGMQRYVNMRGKEGVVDIKNRVQFRNRLIITRDGKVDVIQATGKEAATKVPEKRFLENLADKVGADRNSVSFKNGWGEVGMKLRGQEISIKNPHSGFDTYEEIREHAEKQIIVKAKEVILENPLAKGPWVTFQHTEHYERLKGLTGLKDYLLDGKNPGAYAVLEIPREHLPGLALHTRVFGVDIRPPGSTIKTDGVPEATFVAVPSGHMMGKDIIAEKLSPTGSPKEMLSQTAREALHVEKNIDALKKTLDGINNDQAISFAHTYGETLYQEPARFRELVSMAQKIKESLGGNLAPLMDGGAWDTSQLATDKFLPATYTGEHRARLLELGRTMDGSLGRDRANMLHAFESKDPRAIRELFPNDTIAGTRIKTSYHTVNHVMAFKGVRVNGDTPYDITINTQTQDVWLSKSRYYGVNKQFVGKLHSIKSLLVRE